MNGILPKSKRQEFGASYDWIVGGFHDTTSPAGGNQDDFDVALGAFSKRHNEGGELSAIIGAFAAERGAGLTNLPFERAENSSPVALRA